MKGGGKSMYVALQGGLGNQLFIYAAALAISKKTGSRLYIFSKDTNKHSTFDYRSFMDGEKVDASPEIKAKYDGLPDIVPKPKRFYETFTDATINYQAAKEKEMKLPEHYYQSFIPILPVIQEIKEGMMKKEFTKPNYAKVIEGVDSASTAFMHIRRGDYIDIGWNHNDDYYKRALARMNKCGKIKKIVVLSNDIAWCRGKEPIWKTITQKEIECKDIPNELEAYYYMLNCRGGAILSTSTFSAWAAIMGANENPEACIVYPFKNIVYEKEFGGKQPPNIYGFPDRWIAI
jgi:hypothetical protein